MRANLDQFTEVNEAKAHLQAALEDRECLLVLDDVWDLSIAQTFLDALGPRCRLLLTTRDGSLANKLKAHVWRIDRLDDKTARSLLAESAGVPLDSLPPEADGVLQECGNLPYPLAQCGATIRNGNSWHDLLDALRQADVSYFAERLPNYEYADVFKSIQVSVDFLSRQDPTAANRYLELAVFPAKQVPEAAVVTLWTRNGDIAMDAHASSKLLTTLHNVALVERLSGQGPERLLSLHDLQVDYVRAVVGDVRKLHETLLQAYYQHCRDGWATGPNDGYFFQYLPWHLKAARCTGELRSLLLNPEWLERKLDVAGVYSLTSDFNHLPEYEELRLLQGAIDLSLHVLDRDRSKFASQVVGRLLPYQKIHVIKEFTSRAVGRIRTPWLRPLQPTLHPPGTSLVCTLAGYTSYALSTGVNGQLTAYASRNKMLKGWGVPSGCGLRPLTGHKGWVTSVAVTPDGRLEVSASEENTLKVWEVESGREGKLRTLQGHTSSITDVALSGDGRLAVSASGDLTLKVWEVESGCELRTLKGHTSWVIGVALSEDGRLAFSASEDKTLKVWEMESGRELRTLQGHTDWIRGVAMSGDGRLAISASADRTLKVWEVESGRELRTLTGHSGQVYAVAVTPDGRRAVSASEDQTLKVWDLDSGRELRTLTGHGGAANAVAVTPDGQGAVSASYDGLKVWNLERRALLATFTCDADVQCCALADDCKLVVAGDAGGHVHFLKLENTELHDAVRKHGRGV